MKRKFNIVFASHTYMGGTFVVGSHHLARELSQMGHRVLHLSTPITPFHIGNIKDSSVKHKFKRMISKQILKYNNNLIDVLPFSLIPWNVSKHFLENTILI